MPTSLPKRGFAILLAVLVAMVALALAGAGLHAVVLRRVTGQPTFVLVMITIGAGSATKPMRLKPAACTVPMSSATCP